MRHGFKALAERVAIAARAEIGLGSTERIYPKKFLMEKGFLIWTPEEIPNLSRPYINQLTVNDPNSWSGITIIDDNCTLIIYNPTHSTERTANTLMHEWAHIELKHKPNRVDRSDTGFLLLSDYPIDFENEADWLSASVLLPRDGILHCRRRGMSIADLAAHFGTSIDLAKWRVQKTGVDRQLSNRKY